MALHILVKFQCIALLLWLQLATSEGSREIIKTGCPEKCGNVSIPYPFGIGDGCFIEKSFEITCNDGLLDSPKPMSGMFNISDISVLEGQMTIEASIARDCSDPELPSIFLEGHLEKFTFSSTKNKFIVIGCDTLTYIGQPGNVSIGTGCLSICNKIEDARNGSCNGVGCCESFVPPGLATLEAIVGSVNSHRLELSFNPCSYAFVVEESSFNFSSSYLNNFKNYGTEIVPVVVDWTVGNETCAEAEGNLTSYACGQNAKCIDRGNVSLGYNCICKEGYAGNPYLQSSTSGGCQDINECDKVCTMNGNCVNTEGNYTCSCNDGYHFNQTILDCSLDESKSFSQSTVYKIVI
ncbi:hypothetical protein MKW94_013015, partial [Papaver nudicaule]|nr:hypothetical protein [Papaver nudicaule]